MTSHHLETPVRIRLYSERYEVAASLFETVFRQNNGMRDAIPVDVTPEEELLMGIIADMDSDGGYFVKPLNPAARLNRNDNGPESMEIYSEGIMTRSQHTDGTGETVTVAYDETELTGMEGAHSALTFDTADPGLVTLTRSGTVTTALTFRSHTRAICTYETPYMPFQVGIHCLTVNNRIMENGTLTLDYIIEIRGGCAERCRMDMRIL